MHHSIKIHWDELNKKEYKTLPSKMLHGRNAYYFTRMDPRGLFAVIQISGNKSFGVSHRALEKLDFEESIKRKRMSQ